MLKFRVALLSIVSLQCWATTPEWESLVRSGRWKVLRYQVESLAKRTPGTAEVLIWRSKVLQAFGQTEEAYRTVKEATGKFPDNADAWAQLGMASGEMAGKSGLLRRMSYGSTCKQAALKALELNPNHIPALQLMAAYYEQAPAIAGGDKAKAAACRTQLSSLDPDLAQRFKVSECAKTQDPARIEGALKDAGQALPKATWPWTTLASRALDPATLRPKEALEHANRALGIDPCHAVAYGLAAQALAAEKKWSEVEAVLARAEKTVPENLNPHYQTARFLVITRQEPTRAEALLRRYLAVEPEAQTPSHAGARWRLALALEQQGRREEALRELTLAAKAAPKDEDIAADLKRLKS